MAEQSYWERMRAGWKAKQERLKNPPVPQRPPKRRPARPLSPDEVEDCGYANGWGDNIPERVRNCSHPFTDSKRIGNNLREISCSICKYKYKVDSSG